MDIFIEFMPQRAIQTGACYEFVRFEALKTLGYSVLGMLLLLQACKKARPMVNRQCSDP
jgi:hypothetical protein